MMTRLSFLTLTKYIPLCREVVFTVVSIPDMIWDNTNLPTASVTSRTALSWNLSTVKINWPLLGLGYKLKETKDSCSLMLVGQLPTAVDVAIAVLPVTTQPADVLPVKLYTVTVAVGETVIEFVVAPVLHVCVPVPVSPVMLSVAEVLGQIVLEGDT